MENRALGALEKWRSVAEATYCAGERSDGGTKIV